MIKIKFQIPNEFKTRIIVYNFLGKEVKTLIDEKLISGEHEILFDTNDLPEGIYFYKLEIEHFSETKKIILTK
jgi:hypothetical protein